MTVVLLAVEIYTVMLTAAASLWMDILYIVLNNSNLLVVVNISEPTNCAD